MELNNLIEINKIFSDGELLNKSDINFVLYTIKKSKNWQYNLAYLVKAIICGHTFLNGNKRTALALILYFLNKNNLLYDENLIIKTMVDIAKMKKPNLKKIQREINKCLK